MANCLAFTSFILRILFFFGIMLCGAIMIGCLMMDNRDLQSKNSNCNCPLTLRWNNCNNGSEPCSFIIFTSVAMIVMGFVFLFFAAINLIKGSVDTSKFIIVETVLVALAFLLLFASAIMISVMFQQICHSFSDKYGDTNCDRLLSGISSNFWDRLTATEGSCWALVCMLAIIFIIDLPRCRAALHPLPAAEVEGRAEKPAALYKNFDNDAGTSGPV